MQNKDNWNFNADLKLVKVRVYIKARPHDICEVGIVSRYNLDSLKSGLANSLSLRRLNIYPPSTPGIIYHKDQIVRIEELEDN